MMALFFGMGIGLLIVALAGLGRHVPGWASWLTFSLGVASMIAGAVPVDARHRQTTAPVTFFGLLGVLSIAELAKGVQSWFTWLTFGASLIYLAAMFLARSPRGLWRPQVPAATH